MSRPMIFVLCLAVLAADIRPWLGLALLTLAGSLWACQVVRIAVALLLPQGR